MKPVAGSGKFSIAFQGEEGAFGEEAADLYFDLSRGATLPLRSFAEVFDAVEKGAAGAALVPVENSYAGSINEVYDRLHRSSLQVFGEVNLRVRHCLLALPRQRLEDVRVVYSHPQALYQCASFLEDLGVEARATYDTAGSARMISTRKMYGAAAIAGRRAARIYQLEILKTDIQTLQQNYTRFYVVGRPENGEAVAAHTRSDRRSPGYKTALIMATPHVPGSLYHCLGVLANRGINMTRLESRPRQDRPWEYLFVVDCEGRVGERNFDEAMAELQERTTYLRILGSFPRDFDLGEGERDEDTPGEGEPPVSA